MNNRTLVLYTRNRCPLCDKAKSIIMELKEEWNFIYKEKDIDTSDDLTEKYGLMIPVVEIDGSEVQYGQIDKWTIEEALKGN
ncbi:glutaredoxin family protein [Bacillus sp. DTU_2020_1000418_1_SI_GHA_SEK_038]|uniref:glutaredoxin family protein n=1 Tax=Bacillus sp. DTU_2020_1000418_1_SI_GHA_SEK_038 TaxID=3077585 RepID=UPI0028E4766D|nr:glutaredoxin family protein [Bacillus sp. DTU_2020_1000418_1_SI_GHA_SEK_038]WNS75014.1 glutaredoxin family protein [Bacillus sp. DTU_2020_1000418_1_SI_GHA_SEK_038]